MKYPLEVKAKIYETTSKVASARIIVVDAEGYILKEFHGDPKSIEDRIEKARKYIKYVTDMDQQIDDLVKKGILDGKIE